MRSLITAAVILMGASAPAFAQNVGPSSPISPSSEAAPATTGGIGSSAKMSAVEAKLKDQGYSDVKLQPERPSPPSSGGSGSATGQMWTGTAVKDGKQVTIVVDDEGTIREK